MKGERYKYVSSDFRNLIRGSYGRTPLPINREFQRRIAGEHPIITERAAEGLSPAEAVAKIALGKAMSVANLRAENDLVIAADTLVCLDGELLGKPKDEAEAFAMLKKLSGNENATITAIPDGVSVVVV